MHSYLRAIGFSNYKTRKQLESIYASTLKEPNRKMITTISLDTSLIQLDKDFGDTVGLSLVGEYGIDGELSIEHYFPYVKAVAPSNFDRIYIEKQADKESYAGLCEDISLGGMSLIFYLQNISDYAKSKWFNYSNKNFTRVDLSALSTHGTILLGVRKSKVRQRESTPDMRYLDDFAKTYIGRDKDGYEYLSTDMGIYSALIERSKKEDILSIISTSLMPCGVECDHYMVIGNIIYVHEEKNVITDETVYNILLEVNDLKINVAINKLDLQGEPLQGRRFRGEIWLQGRVRI